MSNESESDSEPLYSGLRYEWLESLKKEELKTLCQNREIDTEYSTKNAIIKSLLKSNANKALKLKGYDRLTKPLLQLELKAKDIDFTDKATKSELIELLKKNKKSKLKNDTLLKCKLSELQKLCNQRSIETEKRVSSKKELSELLKKTNAPDPIFAESMTSKQLMAEMKGRGLSITKMDKSKMLKILNSNISYEDKQLETHINSQYVDSVIQNTQERLINFIKYMKENTNKIKKLTKKNQLSNNNSSAKKRDYLSETEWLKLEDALRTARDEIIDLRTMIETYGGVDLGKDEILPQYKNFDNIIDYGSDSDDLKEENETIYVVYHDDKKLIMDQNSESILGLFENESEAEQYKQQLSNNNNNKKKNYEIAIQEIVVNNYNGADLLNDDL